jgi:hypothetical protein
MQMVLNDVLKFLRRDLEDVRSLEGILDVPRRHLALNQTLPQMEQSLGHVLQFATSESHHKALQHKNLILQVTVFRQRDYLIELSDDLDLILSPFLCLSYP